MEKNILITGATGFIGRHLVKLFVEKGYIVYAGVRSSSPIDVLPQNQVHLVYLNLSNETELVQWFSRENIVFEHIIHCAGITKTCKKQLFHTINYQYTQYLVRAIEKTQVLKGKFLYISSLASFGSGDEKTMQPLREDQKPQPVSAYGKSKYLSEQFLKNESSLNYLIMRPTGVYGAAEQDYYQVYKSIKAGLEFYISSSQQAISFIHVEDLSCLIYDALQSPIVNQSYFVSDMQHYTTQYFNQLLKKELGKKTIRLVFPKSLIWIIALIVEKIACVWGKVPTLNTEKYYEISARNWLCDSSSLKRDFNFQPRYLLEEGLHETLKWYRQEKWL